MSFSTSAIDIGLAKEYDYNETANTSKSVDIEYIKVTPENLGEMKFTTGQSAEYTVNTPSTRCVVPAKCFARYNYSLTWGKARAATSENNNCLCVNSKTIPFWHNLSAHLERGKMAVFDAEGHLAEIANLIGPYEISQEEFKRRDPSMQTMFPEVVDSADNRLITDDETYGESSSWFMNPQYVQAQYEVHGTELKIDDKAIEVKGAKAFLKDLSPDSFFSLDKVMPASEGEYVFSLGFPERHVQLREAKDATGMTSAQLWYKGTAGASNYTGTLQITNLEFFFAVDKDLDCASRLKKQINEKGFILSIPYPKYWHNQTVKATSHQVSNILNPVIGKTVRKIFTAPTPSAPALTVNHYDNNNLGSGTNSIQTTSSTLYSISGAIDAVTTGIATTFCSPSITTSKLKTYFSALDGTRINSQFNFNVEDKYDYLINGNKFGDSIIQNNLQYLNNYSIIEDFTNGVSKDKKIVHSGLLLTDRITYAIEATTADSAYDWQQVCVYEKLLTWTQAGISFV